MSRSQESFDHVIVGAGLAGLITFEQVSGTKVLLESSDVFGGRFSSGLHVMTKFDVSKSKFLKSVEDLAPIKIRWDREWVSPSEVEWKDAAWKGVYLKTWDHYFGQDLCLVEFDADAAKALLDSQLIRFSEPVVELGAGEGEGAWAIKTPKTCITAGQVHWCAGVTAFQNAVGKHASQKFLGENVLPTDLEKDFRGGFAVDWTLSLAAIEGKTQLCPEVAQGGLFGIPVKHGGSYMLMIVHLTVSKTELVAKTLTYVHEDTLRDPKESLSMQKALKRGLKMFFMDQSVVDLQTSSERMVVDQRLLGASRGLTWLLAPQPDIGLHFAGEEALLGTSAAESAQIMGLSRVAESIL